MNIEEIIGKKIRKIRKEKCISQEKLALDSGIDRTYMQSIESGKRNISVKVLHKVLKTLNIKESDFFKIIEQDDI